ncbi:MAG: dihydropteroate synthase [Comamonadaceae bacterium]|nr:MAG: dihydropteroate synthase [Comamonadaceae bacterium]
MKWQTSKFLLDLTTPRVMGIVNVTPDSFSDGGCHADVNSALRHCEKLLRDGADILDIGAESTRPGAAAVTVDEELARLVPVLREAIRLGVPVSVDSYKPDVMQVALDLGVDIINDVWALRWRDAAADSLTATQVVARHPACGICLMHMHGEPSTMQLLPMQGDAVAQARLFLQKAAGELHRAGVEKNRIVIDPGIGFGKSAAQNFALLARQAELLGSDYPLLVGWSRKSSLGALVGTASGSEPEQRLVVSVTAAVLAVERGASIVRVHDVLETVQALKVLGAIR